ncbi:hypothetical protein [Ruania zhangjianzhongii]|uniref:hypothetical protein n=1 Tax=Ruania zhangjianzhongii TaxID=2603206 RepID=UPI0011CA8441|nr:hypothetical protein [Ruania zhangjianzhongii]
MTTTAPTSRPSARTRPPAAFTIWIGLALTVLAALAPLLDLVTTGTIEAHVRATYPDWPDEWVQADTTAIAVGLGVIGLLGIISWLITLRATIRGRRWVPIVATILWILAVTVTAYATTTPTGAYDRMVPTVLGLITALPCLAGVVAVVQLWRHRLRG